MSEVLMLAALRGPGPLILAAILALVAAGLGLYALSNRRRQLLLTQTPTTAISALGGGFAEVKGVVRPANQPVMSPMSNRPCVYYEFKVEQLVKRGKSSTWKTLVHEQQDSGCLVDDGTGFVWVRLKEAELHLQPDTHARSGFMNDASPEVEELLRSRYQLSSVGWVFNKTMRYTETVLCDGDELYVLGTSAPHNDGGYEFRKGTELFIVSDQPEEKLSRSFGSRMWGGAVGGAVVGVASLAVLALSYG